MGNRSRSHTERLARILDSLGEHIRTVPDEELPDDPGEEGRNPAEAAARIKGLLQRTFKAYQQKALVDAQEAYQREISDLSERRFNLPKTVKGRKEWFLAALVQAPQLKPAFTLQNRELSDLSDEDIETHLKKLSQLGVLDAITLPEEE